MLPHLQTKPSLAEDTPSFYQPRKSIIIPKYEMFHIPSEKIPYECFDRKAIYF